MKEITLTDLKKKERFYEGCNPNINLTNDTLTVPVKEEGYIFSFALTKEQFEFIYEVAKREPTSLDFTIREVGGSDSQYIDNLCTGVHIENVYESNRRVTPTGWHCIVKVK